MHEESMGVGHFTSAAAFETVSPSFRSVVLGGYISSRILYGTLSCVLLFNSSA